MSIRRVVCAVAVASLVGFADAQPASGSLAGLVQRPDGSVLADAPVRARNAATGTDARTRSSASGRYELEGLPAGTYVVSVHMTCCEFDPYVNDEVVVEEGVNELVIVLPVRELGVEGDDPRVVNAELLSRQAIPDRPVPRAEDGKPDLSGVWLVSEDPYPEDPAILPWVEPVVQERIANSFVEHPHMRCLPSEPAFPGATSFMVKFVQTPELIVLLFEDAPNFRQIFLDGRAHPPKPNPTWMGHSVGRWEGDTLVIDTVGFNDRGWTGVYPRSTSMRMEERYRRTAFGRLELRLTVDDPGVFSQPWVRNVTWDLAPQEELMEYVCENNKWAPEE